MFEIALLALMNTLANWGTAPVIATRVVPADAPALHALLDDAGFQRRLVAGISPRLHPEVRLAPRSGERYLHATVRLLGHDVLWITWLLTPDRGTTELDLAAQLQPDGIGARLVLLAARRRLLRHLAAVLDDVAVVARCVAEDLDTRAAAQGRSLPSRGRTLAR
jgi:hypothetical protein